MKNNIYKVKYNDMGVKYILATSFEKVIEKFYAHMKGSYPMPQITAIDVIGYDVIQ